MNTASEKSVDSDSLIDNNLYKQLAESDLQKLSSLLVGADGISMAPTFDNRFFNHFVNSPNFNKRL